MKKFQFKRDTEPKYCDVYFPDWYLRTTDIVLVSKYLLVKSNKANTGSKQLQLYCSNYKVYSSHFVDLLVDIFPPTFHLKVSISGVKKNLCIFCICWAHRAESTYIWAPSVEVRKTVPGPGPNLRVQSKTTSRKGVLFCKNNFSF